MPENKTSIYEQIKKAKGEWQSLRFNISSGTNSLSALNKIKESFDYINDGLGILENIISTAEMLTKISSLFVDPWRYTIQAALGIIEDVITQPSPSMHMIGLPVIAIVGGENFEPKQKIAKIYDFTFRNQLADYVSPYGIVIDDIKAYGGRDLLPYYRIIRDSIYDMGDPNAPRFPHKTKMAVLTLVAELGSSLPNIPKIASGLSMMPMFNLKINTSFAINAIQAADSIMIKFDNDSIINALVRYSLIGGTTSIKDYKYILYRTIINNKHKTIVSENDLTNLLTNNWICPGYSDDGDKKSIRNKNLKYSAEIRDKNNKPVLFSNTDTVYYSTSTFRILPSFPPDWEKVSLWNSLVDNEAINNIFSIIRSIIDTLGSLSKSYLDAASDTLESIKNTIQMIRNGIRLVSDILQRIMDALTHLLTMRYHINYNIVTGTTKDLVEHYNNILVNSPPSVVSENKNNVWQTSFEVMLENRLAKKDPAVYNLVSPNNPTDKFIYLATAVAGGGTLGDIEAIAKMFSATKSESQEAIEKVMKSLSDNIKEFQIWLNSQPTLL